MALYLDRTPRDTLREWTILGHLNLSSGIPFRPSCHPHAHTQRSIPAVHALVSKHLRLPPQVLQPRVGSLHNPDRPTFLHDQ